MAVTVRHRCIHGVKAYPQRRLSLVSKLEREIGILQHKPRSHWPASEHAKTGCPPPEHRLFQRIAVHHLRIGERNPRSDTSCAFYSSTCTLPAAGVELFITRSAPEKIRGLVSNSPAARRRGHIQTTNRQHTTPPSLLFNKTSEKDITVTTQCRDL